MALTGMNLCKSAKDSQKLIYKKGSRYVFTMITGMAFRFVGVVFIAGATGGFMYFMLHNYVPWVGLAVNWINPTIIASLIGLIIAGPFMSVLNIASETIIVCMMIDEKLERPQGLRPKIMELFDMNNEK